MQAFVICALAMELPQSSAKSSIYPKAWLLLLHRSSVTVSYNMPFQVQSALGLF